MDYFYRNYFLSYIWTTGFENWTVEELKMLAEWRNIDGQGNISRQQLENDILNTTLSVPKPTSKAKPKAKPKRKSASKAKKKYNSKEEAKGKSKA